MSLMRSGKLELVTFDGDVTLYDDGHNLSPENPVIERILALMRNGTRIGIVTAAGYTEAEKYYQRLFGLLDAVAAESHNLDLNNRLVVMGGEANFLFRFDTSAPHKLQPISYDEWRLPEMKNWTEENIADLLDVAEAALKDCVQAMHMPVQVLRKERAVGIYPPKVTLISIFTVSLCRPFDMIPLSLPEPTDNVPTGEAIPGTT